MIPTASHPLWFLAAALALAPAQARAQAVCKSMSAADFGGFVDSAQRAIDDDDLVAHGAVYRAFQEQLPCMDEAIPAERWAEFLVGYAVVEFAMGRTWERALDVALGIKPTVSRDYGPPDVRAYVPTALYADPGAPALPADAEIYLDGRRIEREPRLVGLHIVQQLKNGVWNTRLLQGKPFPEDWKVQFVDPPDPVDEPAALRASIFALGGFAAGSQLFTEGLADPRIPDLAGGGLLIGLGSYGAYLPGTVGVFWDVYAPYRLGEGPGLDLYAGPAIELGMLQILPGVGASSVAVTDRDGRRVSVLPQTHLGAQLTTPMSRSMDMQLGAGGGIGLSGWHLKGRFGVLGGEDLGWNAGLELLGVTGLFDEQGSDRQVAASAWRFGLRGGVSFR